MDLLFPIKKDKYREARKNYTRMLEIHCRKCKSLLAIYQKDGAGPLRRMYLDRLVYPQNMKNLQKKKITAIPVFHCIKCKGIIAMPYIYKKEKRKALRLFQDTVKKKILRSQR